MSFYDWELRVVSYNTHTSLQVEVIVVRLVRIVRFEV